MRAFFVVASLLLGAAWIVGPAAAQAPAAPAPEDALRRELDTLRRELERAREEYQRALEALMERLRRLEAQGAPAAVAPPPAPGPARPAGPAAPVPGPAPTPAPGPAARAAQVPPTPAPPGPGLGALLQPRPPFALAERTGPGQLLFDLGVSADLLATLTSRGVDRADAGSFAGRENRLFPREIEFLLFGQIDPYARGEVRIEAGEHVEDGERETEVELAEAHLTLLTLPAGLQLKAGQMRARFGLLNERHREALPQPDVPNVLLRFFGEEGLVERGVELSWVPPLPFYLEGLVGIFNGDNEEAFGRGSLRAPLLTGRLRTFLELGALGALQVGASAATGQTEARRRQTFAGWDLKYKLTPEGWRHPLLTLGGEGLWSFRRVGVEREEDVDTDGDGVPDAVEVVVDTRRRDRFGWYAYGEVQPWRRWAFGVRYDATQFLEAPGREWAVEPYVAFMPSDFLRFRLGFKHTERDRRAPVPAAGRVADEIFLQGTFVLGAHPPHPF